MTLSETLKIAREVLSAEAGAVAALGERLDEDFERVVEMILGHSGRIIVTGAGKSGVIGRKIAATMSSTGTPALFLSASDGLHGDLGMVRRGEVVLALSHSGETEEVVRLLPTLKRLESLLVAMTGNRESTLAHHSVAVLDVSVEKEACPHNLAPTTSTTAMLAMGDALAMTLMRRRNFSAEDFAMYHPAGALGALAKALLTVGKLMRCRSHASVLETASVREALDTMSSAPVRGVANVVDADGRLVGIFTDGDLRRKLLADPGLPERQVKEVMTEDPTVITDDRLATEALALMRKRELDNLPVVDAAGRAVGIVDVQDLLQAGII
jgi:arabinose-5-phosphate isomerase